MENNEILPYIVMWSAVAIFVIWVVSTNYQYLNPMFFLG